MSYNCDVFKVKKLENFRLPLKIFAGWTFVISEEDELEMSCTDSTITGKLEGEDFVITDMYIVGEGSGNIMRILEVLFKNSTGTLIASTVWEGGDSVSRLTVVDGKVTWEEIDL